MSFAGIQNRLHAQHTFKNGPFARCRHIRVLQSHPNFHHFVFKIPRSVMRKSAVLYGEYRKVDGSAPDTRGYNYHKALGFFLDLMHRISGIKGKNEDVNSGKDTVVILEYVPNPENAKRCLGWRIHVFTTRCPDVMRTLRKQLEYFSTVLKKNKPIEEHQHHYRISTLPEYVTGVCDIYNNNTKMSSILDSVYENDGEDMDACPLSPRHIFDPANSELEGEEMADVTDDGFVFAHPEYTLRIRPNLLQPGIFFNKYLLDYFMLTVCDPEVYIRDLGDHQGNEITFQTHHPRCRLPDGFHGDGPFVRPSNFDLDAFKGMRIVHVPSDRVAYDPNRPASHSNKPPRVSFGFFEFKSLMNGSKNEPTSIGMLEYANPTDQPLRHKMMIHQHGLSDIDMIYLQSEERKGWMDDEARKDLMVEEFIARCWEDPEANISVPLLSVARWFKYDYTGERFSFPCPVSDMSVFANRNIRLMDTYDKIFSVSASHRSLFLLNHAKYDNWRHVMDMHFNLCFTGDGATSKSHQLEWIDKMSIPGVCETFAYQTVKSEAQDADANHFRYIFNEAPSGMIMKSRNKDTTQTDIMKDRLITQTVRYKSLFIDEHTGKRTSVKGTSQCIATYFGASNQPKTNAEEAMQTRFHWIESEKIHRPGANIHDKMQEEETMSASNRARKASFIMYHQFEDMIMALTWTFIRIQRIAEPNVAVAHRVLQHFNTYLRRAHGIKMEPRDQERIVALCRHLTIVNAKEKLFHTPGGKYHDVAFDVRQIVDMEPLMVCTLEIVIFAIGLCWECIDNSNQRKVLGVLWTQHKASPTYRTMVDAGQTVDYNYVAFPRQERIESIVHGLMPESEGLMSKSTVKTVLTELREKQVDTRQFTPEPEQRMFNDGFPEPDPSTNMCKREGFILEGVNTYVHMALFSDLRRNTNKNVYKDCIRQILHKYTPNRRILLGVNKRVRGAVRNPHLFDVLTLAPRNKMLVITTGVQMSRASMVLLGATNDEEQYVLDMDLDSYGFRSRAIQLDMADVSTFTFIQQMKYKEMMGRDDEHEIQYPHDLLGLNKERKRMLDANECTDLPTLSSKMKRQKVQHI